MLVAMMCAAFTGTRAQTDYSDDYTGNITLSTAGGTSASACKVVVGQTEYDGIKAGTSKIAGAVVVTVPEGTKYLHLHIAGWNNASVTIAVTPSGYSENIVLTSNSGIANNSPFTFNGAANTDSYYKVITFAEALEEETALTFTATGGTRFVMWGVTAEDEGNPGDQSIVTTVAIDASGITNTNVYGGTDAGSLAATVTAGETEVEGATVTWSGNNDEVATINAETGAVTLVAAGSVTFTASYAGVQDQYKPSSKTYTMTVTNSDPNAPGSENNPYTVAEAVAFINTLGGTTSEEVYVSGIISQVDSYNSKYSSITYWISDDGTTEGQMEVYSGKGLGGAAFSAITDLAVGDIVTVKGNVKMYNTTPEFIQNNQLVSFDRPAVTTPTITANPSSLTGFTYVVDNGPSAAQQITIGGENLTKTWSAYLNGSENSYFEFSFIENEGYSSDGSLGSMQEPNQNVLIYVRLKSGLPVGDYDGAITISSEGAETVTVNLSGSVTAPEAPNVTWNLATASYDEVTNENIVTWSSSYATMTNSSESGGTKASNYLGGDANNRTSSRFYSGNTLTITPALGYEITSIVFEATSENYASALQNSTWTNASASVDNTTVTVTPTVGATAVSAAIGGTCGFTSAKVYYQVQAPSAPVWAELPTPEVPVGVEYELDLTDFVSGVPAPTISIETGGDIAQVENNVFRFTPTTAGEYVFTFKATNTEGFKEATLTVTVSAAAASIEVSETTINIKADETTTNYVIVPVTYTNFTPNGAHAQLYEADGVTPLQSNPYTWIMVGTDGTNFFYKINETNTSSEPRTVYCKILANDADNSPVYSDLITITQAGVVVPVVDYATLPFSWDDTNTPNGITTSGVGTYKSSPYMKFDGSGDYIILKIDEVPETLTFDVKGNTFSGGTFTVQTSADGVDYDDLETYTELDATQSETFKLASSVRYIKWVYTEKVTGNVALGNIVVTAPMNLNLNAYGYATYASEYALDFTTAKAEGYSAWEITEVNYGTGTITFNQIKDKVAAGTGVLLMGDPSSEVTLTRTANGEALPDNKLEGITESKQVGDNQYFGLKGNEFVKVNTGVVPAGKALLPIDNPTAGVKSFTLIFNDADGIQTIETVSAEKAQAIFNLAGQRLPKAQKGINIINGKKVLVK